MPNESKKIYVIVRSSNAGCFAGYMELKSPTEVVLTEARRLWYWAGAASLSQLAVDGTSKPGDCKFPAATVRHVIGGWIEIIETTEKAERSIQEVPVWRE